MQQRDIEFSDEEILQELSKRGYTQITPTILQGIKAELEKALKNMKDTAFPEYQQTQTPEGDRTTLGECGCLDKLPDFDVDHPASLDGSCSSRSSTSVSSEESVVPQDLTFTDEEILEALHRLGYDDITAEMLEAVKDEIPKAIEGDLLLAGSSSNSTASKSADQSTLTHNASNSSRSKPGEEVQEELVDDMSSTSLSTPADKPIPQRLVKRKVLRYTKSGTPFVTEDSFLWNLGEVTKETLGTSVTTSESRDQVPVSNTDGRARKKPSVSLGHLSERSELQRRKFCRSDPVTLYHKYKKSWETHNIPGERSHKELRWTLREKMLDYDSVIKEDEQL